MSKTNLTTNIGKLREDYCKSLRMSVLAEGLGESTRRRRTPRGVINSDTREWNRSPPGVIFFEALSLSG